MVNLVLMIVTLAAAKDTFRHSDVKHDSVPVVKHDSVFRAVPPSAPAEKHVRTEGPLGDLPVQLLAEFSRDPVVLTCGLVLIAYLAGQLMVTRKDTKTEAAKELPEAKERKPKRRLKSHTAVAINQKLVTLQSGEQVLNYAVANLHSADIVNIVTAIHRCAKLSLHDKSGKVSPPPGLGLSKDARLRTLLSQLANFLDDDLPIHIVSRAVGNTSWALAKLQIVIAPEDEAVLDKLADLFVVYAEHSRPEEIMNTVWAFTSLSGGDMKREQDRAVRVAKAVVKCQHRFGEFSLQQVIYFAWALARLLGFPAVRAEDGVIDGMRVYKTEILKVASMQPGALTTKNISMICWAVTYLNQRVESEDDVREVLITITSEAAARDLGLFVPGELASIIWALNKCSVKHVRFFTAFREHATKFGLARYSSQDLANIAVAYVNLAPADEFLTLLSTVVMNSAGSFNRLERAMVTSAFAQVPHIAAPQFPKSPL